MANQGGYMMLISTCSTKTLTHWEARFPIAKQKPRKINNTLLMLVVCLMPATSLYVLWDRDGMRGRQGVVLLQPPGPEVCDGAADQPRNPVGLLEGDGERSDCEPERCACWHEEDSGLLPRQSTQGKKDQLDHARIPHGWICSSST